LEAGAAATWFESPASRCRARYGGALAEANFVRGHRLSAIQSEIDTDRK